MHPRIRYAADAITPHQKSEEIPNRSVWMRQGITPSVASGTQGDSPL